MIPHRIAQLLLLVCVTALLAACHSSVRFKPHAHYNSPRRFEEPLIIVLPDDIDTLRESAHVGNFMRPRQFRVFYGEALKFESVARFGGMFTGVFLVSETAYKTLSSDEEREQLDLYSLPESLVQPRGYALHLSRVRFQFEGGRALYMVDAAFENRERGTELFRATMRGRGTAVTVREDTEFMIEDLTEAVISANTSLLNPLVERIRRAIEEQPPAPPAEEPQLLVEEPPAATTPEEQPAEPDAPPHPRLRPFFVTPE